MYFFKTFFSLTGVVYVRFDPRATALTRGFSVCPDFRITSPTRNFKFRFLMSIVNFPRIMGESRSTTIEPHVCNTCHVCDL